MSFVLHDEIKEYQLQYLWSRIRAGVVLESVDSKTIKVVHPGTWNKEEGPDFKNAIVCIDDTKIVGDVEIHITPGDWISHGHRNDKRYSNVILHIVQNCSGKLTCSSLIPNIPIVILPCSVIYRVDISKTDKFPHGYCTGLFAELGNEQLKKLLIAAGIERLKEKATEAAGDILKCGKNEAFAMRLFDALGYKKNRDQFIELLKRFLNYDPVKMSNREIEAVLWGESGLLPDPAQSEFQNKEIAEFVKNTWNIW